MSVERSSPRLNVVVLLAALQIATGVCISCRTNPPTVPIDFSAPGWRVRQGQAVWKPKNGESEIAGELLLATRTNGDCYIQFTKTPFVLVDATSADNHWRIDFMGNEHRQRGRGTPPERYSWFELPRALAGVEPHHGWQFASTNEMWSLERPRTGERLEGRFFQ